MSSSFDEMRLDPQALEDIANFIVIYCSRQREIMRDYLQKMNSLSSEWSDDQTMGSVLQEVQMLANNIERIMDVICFKYPQVFRAKAAEQKARPTY